MTCIIGLIENNKVWVGGDSCGSASGGERSVRKDTKVFRVGEFTIGYTSSFRMGQLLRFKFNPPRPPKDNSKLYEYMVVKFVEELRKCFKKGGYGNTKKDDGDNGGTFLVGIRNKLFTIEDDYQVAEEDEPYASVGCGYKYALGSLESTRGDTPIRRITQALAVAAKFHGGIQPPYRILTTGKDKEVVTGNGLMPVPLNGFK